MTPDRWWLQLASFFFYFAALLLALRLYRQHPWWHEVLPFLLVWLMLEVAFTGLLVVRVVVYWGEPPADAFVTWLANAVLLSGGVSLFLTFWCGLRRCE